MQATYVYYKSDDILTCFASTFSRTSVGLALSKFLLNKNTENDEFHFKLKQRKLKLFHKYSYDKTEME